MMTLSKEQDYLLNLMNTTSKNLFITGKAGAGKSFLLSTFLSQTKKKVVVLAPTGVAALNVSGQTIHSFFCLRPEGYYNPDNVIRYQEGMNTGRWINLCKTLRKVDTIVIDEISMVRVDLFNTLDKMCQRARENDSFFGGIQLILVGDPYQLPPVMKERDIKKKLIDEFSGIYFFDAPLVRDNLEVYELTEVFRQTNVVFKQLLDNIRIGNNLYDTLCKLNTRVGTPPDNSVSIILTTKNKSVDEINNISLSKLPTQLYHYQARATGSLVDKKDSELPTTRDLVLKVGAQIMMLNNDSDGRWVNGSLGRVTKLTPTSVEVEIGYNKYDVERYVWTIKNHHVDGDKIVSETEGTFEQYPLRVAYAITVHKSQGQTYDSVYIKDFTAFDDGQAYVALSRCKDPHGLYLNKPLMVTDIRVNSHVVSFMESALIKSHNN